LGKVSFSDALKANLRPSSLVALVSLALSIGLGIASGSTPIAGLRTAIWGGIACGLFGSSPFNIIGPAGALSGMLNIYSMKWGASMLPWISILSAGFCALFVKLRLAQYCVFMPKSVFEGFTLSVALTIGLKQINYAFGLSGLKSHVEFVDNLWESLVHLNQSQWGSMLLFFPLTAALLLLMKNYPRVPWMVLLPLLTIFFGFFFRDKESGWFLPTLHTKFGELPNTAVSVPEGSVLSSSTDAGGIILAGFTVAFVSVLETLISAKIVEQKSASLSMRNELGPFDQDQEVYALSLGQLLCGICGGLPCTGVFVRTNLNWDNRSTHTISQLLNAIFVLIVTSVAMPVFSSAPHYPSPAILLFDASTCTSRAHLSQRSLSQPPSEWSLRIFCIICGRSLRFRCDHRFSVAFHAVLLRVSTRSFAYAFALGSFVQF
jgi:SulP family sulfate permease